MPRRLSDAVTEMVMTGWLVGIRGWRTGEGKGRIAAPERSRCETIGDAAPREGKAPK
jgi:hypothetical protein